MSNALGSGGMSVDLESLRQGAREMHTLAASLQNVHSGMHVDTTGFSNIPEAQEVADGYARTVNAPTGSVAERIVALGDQLEWLGSQVEAYRQLIEQAEDANAGAVKGTGHD
ncbi:MAG: hypothetical protein Q3962_09465 [Corynebacterium sp.]|nr:hypothetical protein [Corynebacterium sp.]